jgi:thiamine transport system substrate-binding protein
VAPTDRTAPRSPRSPRTRRTRRTRRRPAATALAVLAVLALLAAACGDDDAPAATGGTSPGATDDGDERAEVTIRLITHDSFAVSDEVLEAFTEDTGIAVELLQGGDAGTVVNQAILTAGNPQADVLFGIDSTFLSRALEAGIFEPHQAEGIDQVDQDLRLDPEDRVTPIDTGDVCLNYDRAFFDEGALDVPTSLEDLTDPAYADLLVVQNPATSSPGLAFLLATVATFGEDGWLEFWDGLVDNGVEITEGWSEAYYDSFSGGGASEGDRPLVVSYASSPPAEVAFAEEELDEAPTGVIEASCYRQIEFAGVLAGTEHPDEAGALIDFMLSTTFQEDIPLSMLVFPVNPDAELPDVFVDHAVVPDEVLELPADVVSAERERWIGEWTDQVLG